MKPKVFIASSGQSKDLMHKIAGWLEGWGLEALPWDEPGVFRLGDHILMRLFELGKKVDAAVILFGDEDKDRYSQKTEVPPRDNVLIEYGLFASRLGERRTVVCRTGKPKTPSDLGGLIFAQLEEPPENSGDQGKLKHWAEVELPELIKAARKEKTKQRKAAKVLKSEVAATFKRPSDPKRSVVIQTGKLDDVRDVDVIVSSENTDLQPARSSERSMSGVLRYLDAEKARYGGHVTRDAYLESLEKVKTENAVKLPFLAGQVLPVPTTGLREQGIKYVFHAAMVESLGAGKGYGAKQDVIKPGIENCFREFKGLRDGGKELTSMLFPVFGTGTGQLDADLAAGRMIEAIDHAMAKYGEVERVVIFVYDADHLRALNEAVAQIKWKALKQKRKKRK